MSEETSEETSSDNVKRTRHCLNEDMDNSRQREDISRCPRNLHEEGPRRCCLLRMMLNQRLGELQSVKNFVHVLSLEEIQTRLRRKPEINSSCDMHKGQRTTMVTSQSDWTWPIRRTCGRETLDGGVKLSRQACVCDE